MKRATLIAPAVIVSVIVAVAVAYVAWSPGTGRPSEGCAAYPTAQTLSIPQNGNLASTPNASLMAAATGSRSTKVDEPIIARLSAIPAKPKSFAEWPDAVRDAIANEMGLDTLEEFDVKKKKGELKFEAIGRLPNGLEIELRTDAEGNVLERDVDIHARELPEELMDAVASQIDPDLGDVLVESVEKRERKNGIHYEVRSKAGPWAFETQVDEQGHILDVKAKYRPTPSVTDVAADLPQS